MEIPFVDLKQQYLSLKSEIDPAIAAVIEKTAFIGGSGNSFVKQFEEDFAAFLGVENFISCANGTDSIEILLKAFGIGPGHEVIVPAISWISTSEAVSNIGALPVFVDVSEDTLLIDINKIEEKIGPNTKAIIPVHLYGAACDMDAILSLAKKHNLVVIEDCAQAHGARFNGKLVGTIGDASSFSFYPGKNLGAYGDAGGMYAKDASVALKARSIANHGQIKKHEHIMEGRNSRMDGIQAAVLSVKLKYLDKNNEARRGVAKMYASALPDTNVTLPIEAADTQHVYHLYVIKVNNRTQVIERLTKAGIQTAIHYPTPLPFLPPYACEKNKPELFPVAHNVMGKILSIPMFPEMSESQVNYVCEHLK